MELVKPSVKILRVTHHPLQLIEEAGRTCYKSDSPLTITTAGKFSQMILSRGHESVLEHAVATVRIICDRGVTHEIVRHRLASYSQESTRYCNYGKMGIRFIVPVDFTLDDEDKELLELIEAHYNRCLAKGRSPQQARYFLPNGLKTEIVMTTNMREWRHFFSLRADPAAHPQMQEIAYMLLAEFKDRVPVLFEEY